MKMKILDKQEIVNGRMLILYRTDNKYQLHIMRLGESYSLEEDSTECYGTEYGEPLAVLPKKYRISFPIVEKDNTLVLELNLDSYNEYNRIKTVLEKMV